MIFDESVNVLAPEKDEGVPKKLIDYSVVKKGINAPSMKPKDKKEAKNILLKLSGKTHFVITGVTIRNKEKHFTFQDKTEVTFNELSDSEIDSYLKTNDAMDKAGAYGIQDWIGMIGVQKINGSYTNVMGLPTSKLFPAINKFTL